MKYEEPLLTIAIPTYNSAHFLPDAIASVMRQNLDDFEIVIVDNASEDNTEQVVQSLNNHHIRYVRNASNVGAVENHNRCLSNARGKYIKWLCADDVLLEGVLLKQLDVLQCKPEVVLVSCDHTLTNSELQPEFTMRTFHHSCGGSRVINACMSGLGNYIGGPSNIMFRRADAASLVCDSRYHYLTDLKFEIQLLKHGSYAHIGEAGYLYRRHPNTDTNLNCPPETRWNEWLRLIDEFRWWNLLNIIQVLRRGDAKSRHIAWKHWKKAFGPGGIGRAIKALNDVLYVRFHRKLDI